VAAGRASDIQSLITDDVQLIHGERCTLANPCLGREAFMAALPAAGEWQLGEATAPVRTGNVWRVALQVVRAGQGQAAQGEFYVRGDRVASVIVETSAGAKDNRAAPGRRSFDWAGVTARSAEDLGVASSAARQRLIAALRGGGLALLCRHGNTHWAQQDVFGRSYTAVQRLELDAQRRLNDLGRAEARAIHAALQEHGVKVSAAFSTWWSRTREFGTLVAGMEPSVTDALSGTPSINGMTYQTLLNEAAKRQGLTVLSAHAEPFTSMNLLRDAPFQEGNCVVLKASSDKSFDVLAHLSPGQWAQLGRP
jgi:phosphohistidine phosphatase SixA